MKTNKTYDEHLAKLNALREEMLDIKRDPTAEECKAEAEYAAAFKDMLHTGISQNALKKGSDNRSKRYYKKLFQKHLQRYRNHHCEE